MAQSNGFDAFAFGVGDGKISIAAAPDFVSAIVQEQAGGVAWLNRLQLLYQKDLPDRAFVEMFDRATGQTSPFREWAATKIVAKNGLWMTFLQTGHERLPDGRTVEFATKFSSGLMIERCAPCSIGDDFTLLTKGFTDPDKLTLRWPDGSIAKSIPLVDGFNGEAFHVNGDMIFQVGRNRTLFLNGAPVKLAVDLAGNYRYFRPDPGSNGLFLVAQGQEGYAYAFPLDEPGVGFRFGELDAFNPDGLFLAENNVNEFVFMASSSASEFPQFNKAYRFTWGDLQPLKADPPPPPPAPVIPDPVPCPSRFANGVYAFGEVK